MLPVLFAPRGALVLQKLPEVLEHGLGIERKQPAARCLYGGVQLLEVLCMRAAYQGFFQAQHLQRVMAAARYQAAADKTGVGHAVPEHQFAHGVAQQNLGIGHYYATESMLVLDPETGRYRGSRHAFDRNGNAV